MSVRAEQPKYINGKYVNARGWTMDGKYQYVVFEDGRLRVGKGKGHIDLSNKTPLIYAGEIQFSNKGQIVYWDNNSGHYKPDAAGASAAIPYLNDGGLPDVAMDNFIPHTHK